MPPSMEGSSGPAEALLLVAASLLVMLSLPVPGVEDRALRPREARPPPAAVSRDPRSGIAHVTPEGAGQQMDEPD